MKRNIVLNFTLILVSAAVILIAVLSYNLRQTVVKQSIEEAKFISKIINSNLNSNNVNNTMMQKYLFLRSLEYTYKIQNISLLKNESSNKKSHLNLSLKTKDSIDTKAISSNKLQINIQESFLSAKLRATVPYNIYNNTKAKISTINFEIDMSSFKHHLFNISIAILLLLIISIFTLYFTLNKYIYANQKILKTLNKKISLSSNIVEFTREISIDTTKDDVYTRFVEVLKSKFDIENINIFEINKFQKAKKVYTNNSSDFCFRTIEDNISSCRVFNNKDDVYSQEDQKTCKCFNSETYFHYCIDINMQQGSKIVFNFIFDSKIKLDKFKENIILIRAYINEIIPKVSFLTLADELNDVKVKDGLTGLFNRSYLDHYIQTILPIAIREKFNIALLMIDMDYFKAVNDEYGNEIGDKVLVKLANTLKKNVRNSDIIIRFDGEEFIILLVNISSEEDVINIANKIKNDVEQTEIEVYAGSTIKKTVSIGASIYPEDSKTFNNIIKYADIALSQAKEQGRNKLVRYKENTEEENIDFF